MIKFLKNNKICLGTLIGILILWEFFVTPSLTDIIRELIKEWNNIYPHMIHTLILGVIGLFLSLVLSIVLAIVMDSSKLVKESIYPIIYISQLLPMIVVAPIFVLYFGYTSLPKILLVIVGCFFPITINIMNSLIEVDKRKIDMIRNMGGNKYDVFRYIKFPKAMIGMMAGLKISGTFCLSGALIAEWLGGTKGLGIYMIIAKKSYNYLALYSATLLIVLLSLVIVGVICLIEGIVLKKEARI